MEGRNRHSSLSGYVAWNGTRPDYFALSRTRVDEFDKIAILFNISIDGFDLAMYPTKSYSNARLKGVICDELIPVRRCRDWEEFMAIWMIWWKGDRQEWDELNKLKFAWETISKPRTSYLRRPLKQSIGLGCRRGDRMDCTYSPVRMKPGTIIKSFGSRRLAWKAPYSDLTPTPQSYDPTTVKECTSMISGFKKGAERMIFISEFQSKINHSLSRYPWRSRYVLISDFNRK